MERDVSIDIEDIQTLVKLGLNGSQARVYLTLISLGPANVKKIVQATKIDRGEVYRQLESLQKKSFIEKVLGIPNKYKPLPIKEVLKILIQQRKKENDETIGKAEELSKRKSTSFFRLEEEKSALSIIPKDTYLEHYIIGELESAQKETVWYTQIERIPKALTYYDDAWKAASSRGVQFRIIAELNKPSKKALTFIKNYEKENPSFDFKFVNPVLHVTFSIRDNEEMDFFTEIAKGIADSRALYTNNPQFIRVVKEFFEMKWKTAAKEISQEVK